MQTVVWRNLRLQVPDDWEMLQYSRSFGAGRCAFADRWEFRLELCWRQTGGAPDLGRVMSDYEAALREDGLRTPQREAAGEWRGVRGEQEGVETARWGRYFAGEKCLVEVVVRWPAGREARLEESILASVAEEAPQADGSRRWRAFGMELLAAPGLALTECSAQPACAEMVFGNRSGSAVERFSRRGMVGEWLKVPVEAWLQTWVGDAGARAVESRRLDAGEHRVQCRRGEAVGRGLVGRLLRRRFCEAAAWLCPGDGRLYAYSRVAPARPAGAARVPLRCCQRVSLP